MDDDTCLSVGVGFLSESTQPKSRPEHPYIEDVPCKNPPMRKKIGRNSRAPETRQQQQQQKTKKDDLVPGKCSEMSPDLLKGWLEDVPR